MTDSDKTTPHLSAAEAKSYERKIALTALLFLAVIIIGSIYTAKLLFRPSPAPAPMSVALPSSFDGLTLANPRNAYDLPVTQHEKNPKLHFATGRVTSIVPRHDIMSNGSARQNLYARTEFTVPEHNRNCFFHQYMGLTAVYKVNDMVPIQYDPNAKDFCGTARVVK